MKTQYTTGSASDVKEFITIMSNMAVDHLNIAINDTDNLIKNQGKSKMKKARAWRAWVSVSARHQGKLRLTFVLINDIAIFINTLGLGVDGATIIIKIKFIIAITCRPE